MGWNYKAHYFARYGVNKECLEYCPERVTYTTFQQWKILYEADPEHWLIYTLQEGDILIKKYRLPAYLKVISTSQYKKIEKYHYIKFITRRDYRKFNRFVNKITRNNDTYENLRELTTLTKDINEIAVRHTQEALAKEKEIAEQQRRLIENIKQQCQAEGWKF